MVDVVFPAAAVPIRRSAVQQPPDLEQVFSRFVDPVYRFLYSRVGNREDAEDLTSEVFLKAARQLQSDRPEASIAQWLFTVARTVLADHWRRYYRTGPVLQFEEGYANNLPDEEEHRGVSNSRQELVTRVLNALPERYSRVLELRFLRGYSIQETAAELDLSAENVKVIQHRALAKAVLLSEGWV